MNFITFFLMSTMVYGITAFQSTPLSTHRITSNALQQPTTPRPPSLITLAATVDRATVPEISSDAASSLISNLATVALKLRLARHTSVSCHTKASSSNLLRHGTIGPVTVKGRGWESSLKLTCRMIEASVQECKLDRERVFRDRKLSLVTPALGKAMVALDDVDFGNFVTHPLVSVPGMVEDIGGGEGRFKFLKDGVEIVSGGDKDGNVVFYGDCLGERWRCELWRQIGEGDSNRAVVDVEPQSSLSDHSKKLSGQISSILSDYFNTLVFELDGTYLSFRDLVVHQKANKSYVLLALDIKVCKFPSPGAPF